MSQQNHDLWWIWPQERLRSCLLQLPQTWGGPRMDVKILNNLFLTIERGDPLQSQDQIAPRIMVHFGLLKCGKVEMENTIDQGNLSKILGIHWKELILIMENIFSARQHILQGTKKLFMKERGNPFQRMNSLFRKFRHGQWRNRICEQSQDQVWRRQKRMSNVAESCDEHSII